MSYQILACHGGEQSRDALYQHLKSAVTNVCDEVCRLEVPESLKFGSFDMLMKLMDDLQKQDTNIEAALRRIERQMMELDPTCEFKVLFRQKTMTVESYVRSFSWDDTKFPRSRSVGENLSHLASTIQRVDEDVKNKAYSYTEVKTAIQNLSKTRGPGVTFQNADLTDILTPEVVAEGDFIDKDHLITVLVIVPKGGDKEFLNCYEKADEFVVPRSAKQFLSCSKSGAVSPLKDKDGSTLYRVVCFKSSVEALRKTVRDAKCTLREFTYEPNGYRDLVAKIHSLQQDFERHELALKRHCAAAFSDTLVAFLHLKAMRVFVESVLRYGIPANFVAFIVRPTSVKNVGKLRSILSTVFTGNELFGKSYLMDVKGGDETGDAEAYFPYVNLPFTPLTLPVAA